ncbi:predicted protein [Botrytis cinerea T4]|uniref:Uncharacterized protein n=1 Tax=Botryotinia fuckeliana (strain T4) TaxID=999810 RepID=G2YIZ6_BOTF4|nr:predicted protein [Botrytis cinerea T4]
MTTTSTNDSASTTSMGVRWKMKSSSRSAELSPQILEKLGIY